MGDVVNFEHYHSHREAAARAKAIAEKRRVATQVSREEDQWPVGVAAGKGLPHAAMEFAEDERYMDEVHEDLVAQEERDDTYREILDEIESERDDWARSSENGWFYDDDDPD
jgi:hypothetical protein